MNIGIASTIYGTPKGHSYVIRDMVKLLKETDHRIHMYRILQNKITNEFPQPDTLISNPDRVIPKENFEKWLKDNKIDWCIFMEYAQWWDEDHDKLQVCKDLGVKTAGFLVYEKLDWEKKEHYKLYTKIISPTGFQTKLLRKNGLYNAVHCPWGVDKKELDAVSAPTRKDDKVVFYHCAGSGGVGARKNTEAVTKAYEMIRDETTELKISHLSIKAFGRNEIVGFMKYADVILNASRWDTLGLNTLEANMCRRPVIVADTPPMDELVKNNVNGLRVSGNEITSPNVTCPSFEVDIEDLAKKMNICKNKLILDTLKNSSRKFAEQNFDWEKNKEHFLNIFG